MEKITITMTLDAQEQDILEKALLMFYGNRSRKLQEAREAAKRAEASGNRGRIARRTVEAVQVQREQWTADGLIDKFYDAVDAAERRQGFASVDQ